MSNLKENTILKLESRMESKSIEKTQEDENYDQFLEAPID